MTGRKRVINLALQGGGAHGAFTWGTLDRLLDEEDIEIEGISATSAGAMNAAALKHGLVTGGREAAKQSIADFWLGLAGLEGAFSEPVTEWLRAFAPSPTLISKALDNSPMVVASDTLTRFLSPYQFNPANWHPLRAIVDDLLDYSAVCHPTGPKLFIAATQVRTGKPKVFSGTEICTDAILASACLPTLYQAIEIEDPATGRIEAYWDGGYMGNPTLFPLFYETKTPDILIVHINPLEREEVPRTSQAILNRINEISFNASLLRELRNIDLVNRLIEDGTIAPNRMKRHYIHSIKDDKFMSQLGVASKMAMNRTLLLLLHDAGWAAMDNFLAEHQDDIGRRSSVDLRAMFS